MRTKKRLMAAVLSLVLSTSLCIQPVFAVEGQSENRDSNRNYFSSEDVNNVISDTDSILDEDESLEDTYLSEAGGGGIRQHPQMQHPQMQNRQIKN